MGERPGVANKRRAEKKLAAKHFDASAGRLGEGVIPRIQGEVVRKRGAIAKRALTVAIGASVVES